MSTTTKAPEIKLGNWIEDRITKMKGTVTGMMFDRNGTKHFFIHGLYNESKGEAPNLSLDHKSAVFIDKYEEENQVFTPWDPRFEFNMLVRDPVIKFEGYIVSKIHYGSGCNAVLVQPPVNKEGKLPKSEMFHVNCLEIVDKEPVVAPIKSTTNGMPHQPVPMR